MVQHKRRDLVLILVGASSTDIFVHDRDDGTDYKSNRMPENNKEKGKKRDRSIDLTIYLSGRHQTTVTIFLGLSQQEGAWQVRERVMRKEKRARGLSREAAAATYGDKRELKENPQFKIVFIFSCERIYGSLSETQNKKKC